MCIFIITNNLHKGILIFQNLPWFFFFIKVYFIHFWEFSNSINPKIKFLNFEVDFFKSLCKCVLLFKTNNLSLYWWKSVGQSKSYWYFLENPRWAPFLFVSMATMHFVIFLLLFFLFYLLTYGLNNHENINYNGICGFLDSYPHIPLTLDGQMGGGGHVTSHTIHPTYHWPHMSHDPNTNDPTFHLPHTFLSFHWPHLPPISNADLKYTTDPTYY